MPDDISSIQSRISEIQQRIEALSPGAPAATPPAPGQQSFATTLQQAQQPTPVQGGLPVTSEAAALPSSIPTGGDIPISLPGLAVRARVPAASLGPLPSAPLTPTTDQIIPAATQHSASNYDDLIQKYAAKNGLDPSLVRAVIHTESGGDPKAVSRAGAMGLMQLMPANVREAGIDDAFDPEQNIAAGTQQLAGLMKQYGGDLDLTLAGYNAGPGNVRKYGGVPPFSETQNYIRKVKAAMER
ncbi:hypothetical protein CCAX7_29630 [Capsulimonas corticalis]|uniref:Uncharacterized protein n=1 Tax=Capsulimonas corticalis TaxID=2219043 RepID=A0A402CT02_9BACT|nr:lytic transglycosylase domain-containing protein [Capsulimonas corticalis]BDI30912.1 hypothetical protein CCAX7_29630 [Capsulimonas corticalis]